MKINQDNTLYALVTERCNLRCPHCDVYKYEDEYFNEEEFLENIRNFDGRIVIFGGECTLYPDRILKIINDPVISKKSMGLSTNLTIMNDEILNIIKRIGAIATSWNPNRFNKNEYHTWLKNIDHVIDNEVKITVLITLTNDLFDIGVDNFLEMISTWNDEITGIKFENLVSDNTDEKLLDMSDEWLCELYKKWNSKIKLLNIEQIKHWYFNCTGVRTLKPNGSIRLGCPHNATFKVPDKCYSCELVSTCRPCRLQEYCSRHNKFAKLVMNDKGE